MKRRHIAAGALMATAGLGGGLWWRRRSQADAAGFWSLEFEQPDGGRLRMQALRGRALLLNFWATWCPPCVAEMPLLDGFQRTQRVHGWQVVGLAVDQAEPVRDFLKRQPVSFAVGMAGLAGIELTRRLGNPNGAMPFSVVWDASGTPRHRKLGAVAAADLEHWRVSVR